MLLIDEFRVLKHRFDRVHGEALRAMDVGDWDRVQQALQEERAIIAAQTALIARQQDGSARRLENRALREQMRRTGRPEDIGEHDEAAFNSE